VIRHLRDLFTFFVEHYDQQSRGCAEEMKRSVNIKSPMCNEMEMFRKLKFIYFVQDWTCNINGFGNMFSNPI